jgi:ABC-2 type transport system ATP-binding protein
MINGIPNTNPASKNFLGYFPEKALFPEATSTFNYLLSMAKLDGMNYHDAVAAVERVLKQVGIKELEKRCPNSFSSGQKKKVLLAQALLTNPSILIMDEPTAMLDPAARQDLFKHIAELRKLGKSILISSHVLTELEKYADSVTIIEKGNLIYTGNIHDINEKITKNLYVVDVDKYDVVKKYCNQKKLYDTTIKDKYCVQLSTEAQKQALFNFIEDSHLILEKFYPYVPSLEDVYDKLTTIAKKKIAKGVKK